MGVANHVRAEVRTQQVARFRTRPTMSFVEFSSGIPDSERPTSNVEVRHATCWACYVFLFTLIHLANKHPITKNRGRRPP